MWMCVFQFLKRLFSLLNHSVSNQIVVGYIVNKNAKTQQQTQNRSLELLLNQQQTHHLLSFTSLKLTETYQISKVFIVKLDLATNYFLF